MATGKLIKRSAPAKRTTIQLVEMYPSGKPKQLVDHTFQFAMWPVLAMGQFFGMMPLIGVKCAETEDEQASNRLTFRWRSLRVMWAMAYLVLGSILAYLYVIRLNETGITAKNLGGGIYFLTNLLCNLIFFRMAMKWKPLIAKWTATELPFLREPYSRCGMLLSTRIRMTAAGFVVLTFIDYINFSIQTFYNYAWKREVCQWDDDDHLRRFFTMENRYIFEQIPFSVPLAVVKTCMDIINTVGSSFGNVFIMLISIGLVTRFRQLNHRINSFAGKKIDDTLWNEVREDYVRLCDLLDMVDIELAPVILMSCATNLFFICFRLLDIFEKLPHMANYIYYWYSLLYLIGRTACVFLSAAAINDASREPLLVIKSIDSADWSSEVDRFADQINGETVALSGMKFFYLTRKVLLTMVGTILTYELVLLQFAESTKETDDKIESAEAGC